MHHVQNNQRLGISLIRGELADLSLYRLLQHQQTSPQYKALLAELIEIEVAHVAFWKDFFKTPDLSLTPIGHLRIAGIALFVRLFGATGLFLVLEATEVHGIRKYLELIEKTDDPIFQDAIRKIVTDELAHEDSIVSGGSENTIQPDRVRNFFLGFNDGSVEILGAVSGFSAAFSNPQAVFIAGVTVAAAGCISMAAGAFAATDSEREINSMQALRKAFLREPAPEGATLRPLQSSIIVGGAYFLGAAIPVLPFILGAHTPIPSIIASGSLVLLVSALISFLSGLDMRRRMIMNITAIILSVGVSYAIGHAVQALFAVQI